MGGDAPQLSGASLPAGRCVLLVEDNPDTLGALLLLLEGALVTAAPGAHAALEHAETGKFDRVISNVAMPDMDSLQLIGALRFCPR